MAELIASMLAGDQVEQLAFGVFFGLAFALFTAAMWLRVWSWLFALLGLRA